MLNALVWALACFGVVAADIALSMVLFSVLDIVSALTGFPIDNLDIQWFQAAAQTASFLMALLWWRYLWPRSFMARRQGERPLGGGAGAAWKRIVCIVVIGLSMQVVISYLCDGVLSLLPEAAALRFARSCWCAALFLSFRSERLTRSAAHFGSADVSCDRKTAPWCPGRPQARGVSPRQSCCRRPSLALCI